VEFAGHELIKRGYTHEQFYALDLFEVKELLDAWQEQRLEELWKTAYWVSCLMNIHLKKEITPKQLMKPFLPDTAAEDLQAEREYFIEKFNLGKGDMGHGDKGSRPSGEHRG
jgi:hypothetical protein